ncbi:hypothetical protein FAZ19_07010 [Sphingobacterium alkalisoli]|uniref:Uncharacterized protein n=1 Tax=Sphingobacterium alkalisoli TaxID=1874115 RepID=A0A4U0H4Q6_9SPHI|nr:hypothetical protein [Sphingobacterium alkalisoli]TJY66660.1 hypothetical protein FAZ19_07010 [Sphingobacterium alkalisoli]
MMYKLHINLVALFTVCVLILNSCALYQTKTLKGSSGDIDYENIYIRTSAYEGVIFSEHYLHMKNGLKEKFTPTLSDIELTEALLRNQLKGINIKKINQGGSCPVIDKKLNKYKRQYFGYIDANGDKIISINCLWEKKGFHDFTDKIFHKAPDDTTWKTDEKNVLDGCSYYWTIKVNLTSKALFDLYVNGLG